MTELSLYIQTTDWEQLQEALNNQEYEVFNTSWNTKEELLATVDSLGLTTLLEAEQYIKQLKAGIVPEQFLNVVLKHGKDVTWPDIHKTIKEQFGHNSKYINNADASYKALSVEQLTTIAKLSPTSSIKWAKDTMDCDDFTKGFLGWLALHGLGNLAIGFVGYTAYDVFGNLLGGHAVALAIDDENKVWFIEPQDGKLYPVSYKRLGGYSTAHTIKLEQVVF